MHSVRRYVALRFLALFLVVQAVVTLFGYSRSAYEAEELYDAELAQSARLIMGMLERPLDRQRLESIRRALATIAEQPLVPGESEHDRSMLGHPYEKKLLFQVYDTNGNLLFSNINLPIPLKGPGYHWADTTNKGRWRLFTLYDDADDFWLQTGQQADMREEITQEAVLEPALFQSGLMMVSILALLGWLLSRGLKPLRMLSAQVARRSPVQLAPLKLEQTPSEVKPLVAALNALLAELHDTLTRERRFTDSAAHELRTPLAAAQLHLDNAISADSEQDRSHSLAAARSAMQRLTHLVGQLLILARLEGNKQLPEPKPVSLLEQARAMVAEMYPLAAARQQQLAVCDDGDWQLSGDQALLAVMVRNLLDNALRYSPEGSKVQLNLRPGLLCVDDSGPGIPAQESDACLQRFHRASHDTEGAGLGLAIVVEIVRRHGLELQLHDSELGGLRVCIKMPGTRPGEK